MTIRRLDKPPNRPSFAVYDFEWYPGSLVFRMAGFYDGSRYRDFRTLDDFLNAVLVPEYRGWWLFAHFGGAADFCFLIEVLRQRPDLQVAVRFSGSAAVYVEVSRSKRETWIFVDSFFLLRASLRDIGKKLGMLKGGAEDDLKIFHASYEELREYNEQDNRILYEAINLFVLTLYQLGGEMRPTAASCALALFRRQYLRANIRTNEILNVRLIESYKASRVEPLRAFGDDLYQFDINSSFPYSMTFPHPGSFLGTRDRVLDSDDMFFVDCEYEIDESLHVPPLPYRIDGRLFFPVGDFGRGWITGVDFRLAEKYGKIRKVHDVMLYDKREDLRDFVEDIYARRKVATGYDKDVLKLLMNGCYGKFCEGVEKDSVILNPRSRDVLKKRNPDGSQMAKEVFPGCIRVTEIKTIHHRHVPIGAWVTALSRRWITEYMIEDGDPYYVDTDCIVTKNPNLPVSKELGGLKLEAKVGHGEFYAAKFYYMTDVYDPEKDKMTDKVRAKGFSRITIDGFRFLVTGNIDPEASFAEKDAKPCTIKLRGRPQPAVAVERMSRPKEILNDFARRYLRYERGVEQRPSGALPTSEIIPKTVYFEVTKRKMAEDGTSRPFHTSELQAMFGD